VIAVVTRGAATQPEAHWPGPLHGQSTLPLDISVSGPLIPIPSTAGEHFVYELRVANFRASPVELLGLEVLADDGRRLQHKQRESLDADILRPGSADDVMPGVLGGGSFAVILMEVISERAPRPGALIHRFEAHRAGQDDVIHLTMEPVGIDRDDLRFPFLGPPLRGERWAAVNGLSNESDHRRTLVPLDGSARISQRFAIDWVHFHVTDGPGLMTSEGIPFVFEHFTILSIEDDMDRYLGGESWAPADDFEDAERRRKCPFGARWSASR
jgi:hypothetical protein